MLKAARAQGIPMMVIAMITAAISHSTAIQRPPNTIHARLNRMDNGDMTPSRLNGVPDDVRVAPARCQCGGFDVPTTVAASPSQERQIQSHTRIIELLVSLCFRRL